MPAPEFLDNQVCDARNSIKNFWTGENFHKLKNFDWEFGGGNLVNNYESLKSVKSEILWNL